jgi:hypothetical protein
LESANVTDDEMQDVLNQIDRFLFGNADAAKVSQDQGAVEFRKLIPAFPVAHVPNLA